MGGGAEMTALPSHPAVPPHVAESIERAHKRIDRHEERIQRIELDGATMAEWRKNTTETLKSIRSGITWLITLILGGLLAAVIKFVISGGLNGAQ
ncbi:hypothetical protein U717_06150 [Rhodobacter capsulatus R121]|jgi:small-conductance mechanosensitive channel|nr:hypothetical protein U714_06145 [Rhodobacter capsulatus DE442]ETD78305.1 hypothetical protein U717_06150 [Rhodobacter capsulatus R121]ETE54419.1 hypothetical protein U715_06140 [Rhodobacter capsulatus Y262]